MAEISIKAQNLWMMFNLNRQKEERLKEYVINMVRGTLRFDEFWAIKDISFELKKGDSLGIIGLNGSGKSTLLKLAAGILRPTAGSIMANGVIAPIIELGGGFDDNMTAKENIFYTGSMHGFSTKYLKGRYRDIIDFAELSEFADVPLRNFSTGMRARLGFSIAAHVNPDILIVDEALAVGDYTFREKSMARIREIVNSGATVLFVSHSMEQVRDLCEYALWLDSGYMRMYGESSEVCNAYGEFYRGGGTL